MTDYSSMSLQDLEKIYIECKLDDRFPAIYEQVTNNGERNMFSKSVLVALATECDRQGLI